MNMANQIKDTIRLFSMFGCILAAHSTYADDSFMLSGATDEPYLLKENVVQNNNSDSPDGLVKGKSNDNNEVDPARFNFINGLDRSNKPMSKRSKATKNAQQQDSSKIAAKYPMRPMSKESQLAANDTDFSYAGNFMLTDGDSSKTITSNNTKTTPVSNATNIDNYSSRYDDVTVQSMDSTNDTSFNVFSYFGLADDPQQSANATNLGKSQKASYIPDNMDKNMQALSKTGLSINSAINGLESIERYRKTRIIKVIDENMSEYGLGSKVQVDWTGPIEPLIREIAAVTDYNFKIVGLAPAIPVLVTSIHDNVEIGDIAREAHLQAKERADIVIYPKSKIIEIRYSELG